MKKIISFICALAFTGTAFAQGTVNWFIINPVNLTVQTNSTYQSPINSGFLFPTGFGDQGYIAPASSGTIYYFALLYSPYTGSQAAIPNSLSALSSWQDTGLMATNSSTAGRLAPVSPNAAATVPWAAGTTNNIMLVGWSANLGSSWATALTNIENIDPTGYPVNDYYYFGMSNTGFIAPAASNAVFGSNIFGSAQNSAGLPINSVNMQLYLLSAYITPEPKAAALAVLGGAITLVLRRRNIK